MAAERFSQLLRIHIRCCWAGSDIPRLRRRKPLFLNRKVQVGTTGMLQAFRLNADMHTGICIMLPG